MATMASEVDTEDAHIPILCTSGQQGPRLRAAQN